MAGRIDIGDGKPRWVSDPDDLGAERVNPGRTGRVAKPLDADELMRAIEEVCEGRGGFFGRSGYRRG